MKNLKCFSGQVNPHQLDRSPFELKHTLTDHPALAITNLAKVIADHPKERIHYSKGLDSIGLNFDDVFRTSNKGVDFDKVIEGLKTSDSYIAVRNPELHPSFKELYKDLIGDISALMQANGTGEAPVKPCLWLFIASPNTVTPFHFDRYSNIIMQIRGSKELAVFPPRKDDIMATKTVEAYMDWSGDLPPWKPEIDAQAYRYNFKKGEAVHIPFVSGHYVKNGSEDISITLSCFYHTDETAMWSEAMKMNNRVRQIGYNPSEVGLSSVKDKIKAKLFPVARLPISLATRVMGKFFAAYSFVSVEIFTFFMIADHIQF